MRIALVCPYAWDRPGGVQVHVAELSAELRSRGHYTLILAPGSRAVSEPGVRIVGSAVGFPYQGTVAPISVSPAAVRRVRAELRRFAPDVVHVHEPLMPVVGLAATLGSPGPAALVGTFHAYAERSRLLTTVAPALRRAWRRLAVRIAVSEAAAAYVRSRFAGEVLVIPNGLRTEPFTTARPSIDLPDGRRVAWIGRLDRQKGFRVAMEAFDLLARERPDLSFVVAGDGADRRAVEAASPDAQRRTVMLGTVAHEVLPPILSGGAVFVAPALGQESFGMVLVEAMAAGVPVVASDIAGYREVVRGGIDGLLVAPGDPRALAAAVGRVLDDPELAARLRAAGRKRAAEFDWHAVAPRIEGAYADALQRASSASIARRRR